MARRAAPSRHWACGPPGHGGLGPGIHQRGPRADPGDQSCAPTSYDARNVERVRLAASSRRRAPGDSRAGPVDALADDPGRRRRIIYRGARVVGDLWRPQWRRHPAVGDLRGPDRLRDQAQPRRHLHKPWNEAQRLAAAVTVEDGAAFSYDDPLFTSVQATRSTPNPSSSAVTSTLDPFDIGSTISAVKPRTAASLVGLWPTTSAVRVPSSVRTSPSLSYGA
jgi:hypothetical protein